MKNIKVAIKVASDDLILDDLIRILLVRSEGHFSFPVEKSSSVPVKSPPIKIKSVDGTFVHCSLRISIGLKSLFLV